MIPSAPQRLYHHLLKLYPPRFRAEYGEEIQMVYELTLESKQGRSAWQLVLRELVSTPRVLLRLH
jgi:hypothetical protein